MAIEGVIIAILNKQHADDHARFTDERMLKAFETSSLSKKSGDQVSRFLLGAELRPAEAAAEAIDAPAPQAEHPLDFILHDAPPDPFCGYCRLEIFST